MIQQLNSNLNWGTIFKVAIGVICIYILYLTKDIIVWFIFALVIAVLFNFLIDILEKKKIPRLLAAILLYLGFFALLSFFIYETAPLMLSEIKEFSQNFPAYLARISPFFEKVGIETFKNKEIFIETLQSSLTKAGGSIFQALFSIFGGATSTVLVIALAFFISLEKQFIERIVAAFSPQRYRDYLLGLWRRARKKVSGWFVTRVIGVVFVGAAMYLVLRILNVKYAFVLSLLAGVLDLLPIVGPLIAGALTFILISLTSFFQAVFATGTFIVIQQIENNLLFPILFKRFVGVPPVLVLVALAVGGKLWGVAGAILGIPLAGVIYEVLKDYLARKKEELPQEE